LKQPVDDIVNGRKIDMGLQRIAAIEAKTAAIVPDQSPAQAILDLMDTKTQNRNLIAAAACGTKYRVEPVLDQLGVTWIRPAMQR
jgi:hypothetical protein